MRLLKILTLTVVVALLVAGIASAKVRGGMATVAATAEDVVAAVTDPTPSPSGSPSADPSASPSAEPSADPSAEPAPEPPASDEYRNHGAEVSATARQSGLTGTWVNPAGKAITNHGKAVVAVANKNFESKHAGDPDDGDSGAAKGNGNKDK